MRAAKGYTLLRLTPGPAEAEFGITAAPMAVVADWHGRVVVRRLNLRGDIGAACALLKSTLKSFDRRAASRPPYRMPGWAEPLVGDRGAKAFASLLGGIHSERKPSFDDVVDAYRGIDREGVLIRFAESYVAACESRVPKYGEAREGYDAEVALLEEMTRCVNDKIKFRAIQGYARFAPVRNVSFLVRRAEDRAKDALNPNVVLCECMGGIGVMAERFPGAKDRASVEDQEALLAVLPALEEVLRTEGRNNGACKRSSDSIVAILEATGSPRALGAYIENLLAPGATSEWMKKHTARYHAGCVAWLEERTGEHPGSDHAAWRRWYEKHEKDLVYSARAGRFRIDAKKAKAYRDRIAKARTRK